MSVFETFEKIEPAWTPSEREHRQGYENQEKDRRKCETCNKRRMCLQCYSCDTHLCSECAQFGWTKPKPPNNLPPVPICSDCDCEARDYARYGIWGPP